MTAPATPAGAAPGASLWAFAVLSASYFAFIGYFNPYLPLWLKDLGFSTLAIGALGSVQGITRVVAPYSWGWLSDRTGHRVWLMRIASGAALLCALGLLLTPRWVAPSLPYVGAVLFAMFANTSAMMPMAEAAVAQRVSTGRGLDLRRYGRVRVWGSIGFIVTVVVFGFWFERHGIRPFALGAVLLLLVLACACWALPGAPDSAHGREPAPSLKPVLAQPAVRWFFVSAFLMLLAHVALYGFFSLHLDALGYDKRVLGMLWAVSVLAEIAWFLLQGRWGADWTPPTWIAVACAAAALRFALTAALGASPAALVVAQLLHALTFAAHHSACIAFINHHFTGRLRGRGQALYTVLGYGCSGVLGGVAGGALSEAAGFAAVFWAGSASALLASAAALRSRTAAAQASGENPERPV
ncbi:MFS transporter [Caldimonas brevitalea]|uniref:MFS transporter n=1 Tax=Caldimonas brevitalea TaxID=413882 RepID=A0A0G3BGK7_9BURK|nr:MFS transporter [Caldimonas brevitalea]AKJ28452.1 MFS transporter [Caldimonas brevitalea]